MEKEAKAHVTAHPFRTSRPKSVEGLSVCVLRFDKGRLEKSRATLLVEKAQQAPTPYI